MSDGKQYVTDAELDAMNDYNQRYYRWCHKCQIYFKCDPFEQSECEHTYNEGRPTQK